jgi:CMP-N-acetylneuraminic acid synthetase/regulator of RNase E activity RraA
MKNIKIAAVLPAKGTSERIASKNLKLLNGKPLFLHTLEKLCDCDFIDEVYLDSDSDEILRYAPHLGYIPLKRDVRFSDNATDGHQLLYNAAMQIDADIYIHSLCTSPFIKKETIRKGIDILLQNEEYDSVVLVKKDKLYLWDENGPLYNQTHIPNSADLPEIISEAMSLYFIRKEALFKTRKRIGNKPFVLTAEPIETVDINYPGDFEMAERISMGIQHKECVYFNAIRHYFNSSVFADILFEYQIKGVIDGYRLNLPDRKIMGRANTLKIRALREGEDPGGLYKAYDTYKKVRCGEIIVVENETEDRSYFGELNANLAIRSGAVGTIVSSVTRDIDAVNNLGYPVFSMGYSPADVRGISTMEGHNAPISIKGVRIMPGDLLFADANGIAVIPRRLEKEIIAKAINTVMTEKKVLDRILNDEDAFAIYDEFGAF